MTTTAGKPLLLMGQAIQYLARFEFNVAVAAPLPSPYTEGFGSMTFVDTGNSLSIASGNLVFSGARVSVGDPSGFGPSEARVAGRCVLTSITLPATGLGAAFGWAPANTGALNDGIYFAAGTELRALFGGVQVANIGAYAATTYKLAVVLRAAGAFLFIKGGAFSDWSLLLVSIVSTTTPMFAAINNLINPGAAGGASWDYLRLRDLGGAFATASGPATVDVTAASGVSQVADADGVYNLAFTLPAGSANLVAVELRYRQQDATNYWSAYIKRNAGNTQWDFYLDKVTAGSPATQTGFPVTNVGNVDLITVRTAAATHNTFTKVVNTLTHRGGTITDAAFQTSTTIDPVADVSTTLAGLQCWPYQSPLYNVLSAT